MAKPLNPFITRGYAGREFFCDRKQETAELTRLLLNGNNVFLISPRRLGKSGLIDHCFLQDLIRDSHITIHIDIYATKNFNDFVYEFGRSVLHSLRSKGRAVWESFLNIVGSLKSTISFDINGQPELSVDLGELHSPQTTLEEIFLYLEKAPKPCIVAIDEFQTIANYPEKNTEALLRTNIQRSQNACFIFAGSQRHIITEIFTSPSRPFYMSAAPLTLDVIDGNAYYEFAAEHFQKRSKSITREAFDCIYQMFQGTTWYVQFMLNTAFSLCGADETFDKDDIEDALRVVINTFGATYENLLYQLPAKQKDMLEALAREGKARNITSRDFLRRYSMTASSVQAAVRALLEKDLVTHHLGEYELCDRFLALWIKERN